MNTARIAIIIAHPDFSFANPNSAVANYLKLIGESLIRSGFQVDYFPSHAGSSVSTVKQVKSITSYIKKGIKSMIPGIVFNSKFTRYFQRVDKLNQELSGMVSEYDFIIEFAVYGSEVAVLASKGKAKKNMLIFDAPLSEQFAEMYGKTGKFGQLLDDREKRNLLHADIVVCYSEAVKKYLLKNYSSIKKVAVIPCIAWKKPVERKLSPKIKKIGFIGSFLSWHKVDVLVSAFEKIAAEFPDSELHLIGYGEEWTKIHRMVKNSRFKNRVLMPGFVPEKELETIKSDLYVGVMPGSNWYGSPLKLFEYAESGIPVIAPITPTVAGYFTDGENALLIDPRNEVQSLTDNLRKILSDEKLSQRLSAAGYNMMQNDFAKDKVMSKFVDLINNTINVKHEK